MRERDVERKLVDFVKRVGGRAYKFTSPGNAGVPDRIVVLPNRPPIFVEVKADTGRLTDLQEVQIKRLRDLGQDVRVVKGESGLKEFVKEVIAHEV